VGEGAVVEEVVNILALEEVENTLGFGLGLENGLENIGRFGNVATVGDAVGVEGAVLGLTIVLGWRVGV